MTIKEWVELALIGLSGSAILIGAVYNLLSGTTATRRALLSGKVLEQAIATLQSREKALTERCDKLERDLAHIQRLYADLTEMSRREKRIVIAFEALARDLGASEAQIEAAYQGLIAQQT